METAIPSLIKGLVMIHNLLIFLYALTGGLAVSGIIANIYRLVTPKKSETTSGRATYYIVMAVAGPTVLLDNAAKSWRTKKCSAVAFWLAAALSAYWSFVIGLFAMSIALAI
jgi:hypothetical protein